MQVFRDRLPDNPNSPIQAVERMGIGSRVLGFTSGVWHLVQGVRHMDADDFNGEALLVRCFPDQQLHVLVASGNRNGGIGPRWKWRTRDELADEFKAGVYIAALGQG